MFFLKYLSYKNFYTLILLFFSSTVFFFGSCSLDTVVKESGNTVYRINADDCEKCLFCIDPCPVNAISEFKYGTDSLKVIIDPEKCINCGECAAVCAAEKFYAIEKVPYKNQ